MNSSQRNPQNFQYICTFNPLQVMARLKSLTLTDFNIFPSKRSHKFGNSLRWMKSTDVSENFSASIIRVKVCIHIARFILLGRCADSETTYSVLSNFGL
jgi:hypothetical protein